MCLKPQFLYSGLQSELNNGGFVVAPLVVPWWRHGAMVALQQRHGGGMVHGGVAATSWWLHG